MVSWGHSSSVRDSASGSTPWPRPVAEPIHEGPVLQETPVFAIVVEFQNGVDLHTLEVRESLVIGPLPRDGILVDILPSIACVYSNR